MKIIGERLQTVSRIPWHMAGIIPTVKKNVISHEWVNVPLLKHAVTLFAGYVQKFI